MRPDRPLIPGTDAGPYPGTRVQFRAAGPTRPPFLRGASPPGAISRAQSHWRAVVAAAGGCTAVLAGALVATNLHNGGQRVTTPASELSGTVAFSISPAGNCSTSGDTFSCSTLPVGATITGAINITRFCFGHECFGDVSATAASSVTADPNTANNTATGEWELLCFLTYGNCGA
jgi:hypothetical protein